jgi:hypothetical protein
VGTLVARQKKQRNVTGYQWVIEYEGDHNNDTAAQPPVKGIISERSIQRLVLASSLTPEEDEGQEPITDMTMMMTGEEHPATVSDTSIIHSSSTNGKTNAGGSSTNTKAKTTAGKQSAAATTTTVKRTKHHPPQQQHKSSSTTTGGNNNSSGNTNKTKGITTRLGQPVRKTILKTGILYVYLETRRAEFVRTK